MTYTDTVRLGFSGPVWSVCVRSGLKPIHSFYSLIYDLRNEDSGAARNATEFQH